MFGKQQKMPEDMTDAEMSDRLAKCRGTMQRVNKYALRIFGGVVGASGVAAVAGILLMSTPAAPLMALSIMIGLASVSLIVAGGQRSSAESEIRMLAEERKHRVDMEKTRQRMEAKAAAKAMPQSPLNLREAFDAAIASMGKGIENSMTVRRPLTLKTNIPAGAP
ncbi:MAG: hypothetical protein ACAH83_16280 [Alphaproteobacteria bacterium]